MDAFYASVEMRDNPALRGKPVIVGGMPGTRGVVCTASYEARKYGVHSAMSANKAYQLCPKGVFLMPRFEAYKEVSRQIRAIFSDYTDLIEPLSLDEAYLDVTENKRSIPYATRIAREIRERIRHETGGLTASAGVSYNKFLAKTASDIKKPDGMTVILPEAAEKFLDKLPIGKFYGIGRVTEKMFLKIGVKDGAALKRLGRTTLENMFGKSGLFYYDIVRGIDDREVCSVYERKSLGTEETFENDTTDLVELYKVLEQQAYEVASDLKKKNLAGRTVTLKIKYFDFRTVTRAVTVPEYIDNPERIIELSRELLLKSDAANTPVRLIGITVSHFPSSDTRKADMGGTLVQGYFDFYAKTNF